jgi:tetratricopeptide (TPR) repeat protein
MRRKLFLGCWFATYLIAFGSVAPVVWAQAEDRATIMRAFDATKTAETIDDFSKIISLCEEAQQGQQTKQTAAYAPKLISWALNRRGELYAAEAADLISEGSADRAAKLDAMARDDFEVAVEMDPEAWKPLHNRGVSYGLRGESQAAIADFSRVVERHPEHADAWFNRAEIQVDIGRIEEAISDYTRAIELRPADEVAYVKRASAHAQAGLLHEALRDCQLAIKLDDDSPDGYASRGQVYEKLGQWADAAGDFRKAVSKSRKSVQAYRSAAWLMATCPDPKFRQDALAVQAADQALKLSSQPHNWRTLDIVAAAYANAGRFGEAVGFSERAVSKAANSARGEVEQRLVLYQAGQPYRQPRIVQAAAAVDEPGSGVVRDGKDY